MQARIKKIIEDLGITQSEFAKQIGVERANISHIISGRHKPSYEFLRKVLETYPNLNAEWLMLGKGHIYKQDTEQVTDDIQNSTSKNKQVGNSTNQSNPQHEQQPQNQQQISVNQQSQNNQQKQVDNTNIVTYPQQQQPKVSYSIPEQILVLFDDQTFVTYKKRDNAK